VTDIFSALVEQEDMESKKLKIDPKKVLYDGSCFSLIIENEPSFLERLKQKQAELIEDIEKSEHVRESAYKLGTSGMSRYEMDYTFSYSFLAFFCTMNLYRE
jgi:hypothetical protein